MSEATMQSDETSATGLKDRVRSFWQAEPCGTHTADAEPGTPEFFRQVERRRYELEPYIPDFADFGGTAGQEVLEIGTGLGTDTLQFARAGATISGVDLTERSVALVRERIAGEGLAERIGRLEVADAERLPFADASFDRVYSWGVLHHTPRTYRAVGETLRVLRPGGTACVMLYGRDSWLAWRAWIRYALLRGQPGTSVTDVLAARIESDGTKAYTNGELRGMFNLLEDLTVDPVRTVYDEAWVGPLARLSGDRFGWFRVVRGRKPARG